MNRKHGVNAYITLSSDLTKMIGLNPIWSNIKARAFRNLQSAIGNLLLRCLVRVGKYSTPVAIQFAILSTASSNNCSTLRY